MKKLVERTECLEIAKGAKALRLYVPASRKVNNRTIFKKILDSHNLGFGTFLTLRARPILISGYELTRVRTAREVYKSFPVDLKKLWVPKDYVIGVCCQHKKILSQVKRENLFLVKKYESLAPTDENLFVMGIVVRGNDLYLNTRKFSDSEIYEGGGQHQVFTRQVSVSA